MVNKMKKQKNKNLILLSYILIIANIAVICFNLYLLTYLGTNYVVFGVAMVSLCLTYLLYRLYSDFELIQFLLSWASGYLFFLMLFYIMVRMYTPSPVPLLMLGQEASFGLSFVAIIMLLVIPIFLVFDAILIIVNKSGKHNEK